MLSASDMKMGKVINSYVLRVFFLPLRSAGSYSNKNQKHCHRGDLVFSSESRKSEEWDPKSCLRLEKSIYFAIQPEQPAISSPQVPPSPPHVLIMLGLVQGCEGQGEREEK